MIETFLKLCVRHGAQQKLGCFKVLGIYFLNENELAFVVSSVECSVFQFHFLLSRDVEKCFTSQPF